MPVYTERYVSALQTPGDHAGSLLDPWTFDEAVTKTAAGDRVNVKANGTYTLDSGVATYTWVGAAQYGDYTAPVQWRGYTTTPGDGGRAILRIAGNTIHVGFAAPSDSNIRYTWSAINFDIEGNCTANGTGLLNVANAPGPFFYNCRVVNTHTGDAQCSYGVSGEVGAMFAACWIQAANTVDSAAIQSTHGNNYIGCHIYSTRNLANGAATGNAYGIFQRNVCVCTTPANDYTVFRSTSFYGGTSVVNQIICANNVFYNFGGGVSFASDGSKNLNGIWLNNIFCNATYGFVIPSSPYLSRTALFLLGNKFWNVTTPISNGGDLDALFSPFLGVEELDVDPFVDSANGDFTLVQDSAAVNAAFPSVDYFGESLLLDCGLYEQEIPADYPAESDTKDGVTYAYGTMEGSYIPVERNLTFEDTTHVS